MDELSKEEPGPSAPDPLTWNPSDAIMCARKSKRVRPQKPTLIGIKETYTQNNNYCPFSFIIVIRVANWHISLRDAKSQYFRALVSLFANFEVERSVQIKGKGARQ